MEEAKKFSDKKTKYVMQRDEKVALEKQKKVAEDLAKNNTIKVARGDIKLLEFHKSIY